MAGLTYFTNNHHEHIACNSKHKVGLFVEISIYNVISMVFLAIRHSEKVVKKILLYGFAEIVFK